jgi:hypothetical protein
MKLLRAVAQCADLSVLREVGGLPLYTTGFLDCTVWAVKSADPAKFQLVRSAAEVILF